MFLFKDVNLLKEAYITVLFENAKGDIRQYYQRRKPAPNPSYFI